MVYLRSLTQCKLGALELSIALLFIGTPPPLPSSSPFFKQGSLRGVAPSRRRPALEAKGGKSGEGRAGLREGRAGDGHTMDRRAPAVAMKKGTPVTKASQRARGSRCHTMEQ